MVPTVYTPRAVCTNINTNTAKKIIFSTDRRRISWVCHSLLCGYVVATTLSYRRLKNASSRISCRKLFTTRTWLTDSANRPLATSCSSFISFWYACHLLLVRVVNHINIGYSDNNISATGQLYSATITTENT